MATSNSDPADWMQFLHRDAFSSHPTHPFIPTSVSADSTIVTTLPAGSGGGGGTRSSSDKLSGKAPPRKRSRSSRRAPTTLLNTDTTNFRAMVQQFTGVSTGPFSASYGAGGQPAISFVFGSDNPNQKPAAVSLGHQLQQKRYQYRPPPQLQQQEMMRYSASGNGVEDEEHAIMPGYFYDGMGGAGRMAATEQMERDGGGGGGYF